MIDTRTLRLVALTDNLRDGVVGLTARAAAACRGGATMIHLRLPGEEPATLVAVARSLVGTLPVPVLVHGRIDVALAGGAAGVHLGVRDVTPEEARQLVGARFVVGVSVSADDAAAPWRGADYATVGPVFPATERAPGTALGIDGLRRLADRVTVPTVAIGGISTTTAADVMGAGVDGVALISGILGARDPEAAARRIRDAIET
jgi:thiamine-phosphate diphosphorylase